MVGQLSVEPPTSDRAVGQEAYPTVSTILNDTRLKRLAKEGAQPILNRDHLDLLTRGPNLRDGDVGEPKPADLSLALQLGQRPDALSEGHRRIRRVELIEVDALAAEGLERSLTGGPEVRGTPVPFPAPARPSNPALGGHERHLASARPGRERLRDQPLVVADVPIVEAVDVGGVDQGHPGVQRGVKHADRLGLRGSPVDESGIPPKPMADTGGAPGPSVRVFIELLPHPRPRSRRGSHPRARSNSGLERRPGGHARSAPGCAS